jgi:hypothetical protein
MGLGQGRIGPGWAARPRHVLRVGATTSRFWDPNGSALGYGFMHAAHGGPGGVGLWSTGMVRGGPSALTLSPSSAHGGLSSPSRCLSPPLASSARAVVLLSAPHLLIATC